MRKHFLILMLLTLLPFTAWADAPTVTTAGVGATKTYSGEAQDLFATAPATTTEGAKIYYLISDAEEVTFSTETWTELTNSVKPQGTAAGTYKVWYAAYKEGDGNSAPASVTATINKLDVQIKATAVNTTYGANYATLGSYYEKVAPTTEAQITLANLTVTPSFKTWTANHAVTTGAGTDFTITATAANANCTVTITNATAKIKIAKKDLTIATELDDEQPNAIIYGEDLPTWHLTYAGLIDLDNASYGVVPAAADAPKSGVVTGTVDWTVQTTGLVNYYAGTGTFNSHTAIVGNVETYQVTAKGLSASNYNIIFAPVAVTVNAKALTAAMISKVSATNKVYNGADQQAVNNAVKKDVVVVDGTKTLTADDFTFVTKKADGSALDDDKAIAAATYKVIVTGAGNYTGSAEKTFTIAKKPLGVRSKSHTLTYDGDDQSETITGDVAYVNYIGFDGFVDGDYYRLNAAGTAVEQNVLADANNHPTLVLQKDLSNVNAAINAGDYDIVVVGEDANDDDFFTNYAPVYVSDGVLTISPKAITITPNDKSKQYGKTDNFVAGVTAKAADLTVATLFNGHSITTFPTLKREAGENVGEEYRLYLEGAVVIKDNSATPVDVTNNYNITFEDGVFTVTAGTITIYADAKELTYGDAAKPLTATIIGMTAEDKTAVQTAVNGVVAFADADEEDFDPTQAGVYDLTISEDAVKAAIGVTIMANYSETINIFTESAKYTVNPKALTKITANTQSLTVGEYLSDLVVNGTTITIEGAKDADLKALYAALKLNFANYVNKDDVVEETVVVDKKLTAVPAEDIAGQFVKATNTYLKGIIFDTTADLGNYTFPTDNTKIVAGNLIVSADVAPITFDATNAETGDDNNTALITAQAGQKMDVTIEGRTLQANKWNALSLPFSISVRDLSKTLGYAIVDRFQQSGDKLNFKIYIGEIPAYTPFLVKVDETVDMADKTFDNVIIEAPKTVTEENDTWKFINTVDAANVAGLVYYITPSKSESVVYLNHKDDGADLLGFYAYFKTQSGQPVSDARIYIEEPDGSTTAISAIDADGVAVPANGWYTINGMKLEGMPTEKGVYINNGKKVVVK